MKILMENWRKYLTENKDDYLKTLGLVFTKTDGLYNAYLYEWFPKRFGTGWPVIVGYIASTKVDEDDGGPCIPETQLIGRAAVREERKGRGIGTHMYEIVAYYMKMEHNGGISSDQEGGSTKDAARVWVKLRDKLNYIKRKTPKGPNKRIYDPKTDELLPAYAGENDEFDYNNSTTDPNDDCYKPAEIKPASTNSLQIPASRTRYIAKLIETQLDNFDEMVAKAKEFEIQNVENDGAGLFNREYDPCISGMYGEDD